MDEESLFTKALEISSPHERTKFLDEACGQNLELRKAVEELLELHAAASSFLELPALAEQELHEASEIPTFITPPPDEARSESDALTTDTPGLKIGPYELVKRIGRGGMGEVWLAQQEHPVRRKVALKLIKPGMDSREVLTRFEAERQALALMDHPHIARVFDGGKTPSGRPYFVMELVNGIPLTTFCDKHQLTIRERLELFVPVCQAIQHAHQKGIIHRDIKPSNVLVATFDQKPMVKVIDFGVAKAIGQQLSDSTIQTGFGGIVGTLGYVSPEQAVFNARDIDTRTDVYSLGVLLYEVLTGSTPLDKNKLHEAGIMELLRLVREEEPPRPSIRLSESNESLASLSAVRKIEPARYSRMLRGDLDWIVMKSIEKDRTRRYQTANDLSDDIRRFLNDEAVEACPPSVSYRFRKFVRRHKFWFAASTLIVLALLLGLMGTGWQAYRATIAESNYRNERDEALRQKNVATEAKAEALRLGGLEREQRILADERAEALRRQLHVNRIVRTSREIEQNRLVEARDLLEECDTDLRGWCWRYLDSLMKPERLRLSLGYLPLTSASVRADKHQVALGPIHNLAGDGNYEIKILDYISGNTVGTIPCETNGALQSVAFSTQGNRLVTCEVGKISVWDVRSQKQIASHEAEKVTACCLSPDGSRLAYSQLLKIHILDLDSHQIVQTLDLKTQKSGIAGVQYTVALNFSPDGKTLGSVDSRTLRLWDVETGKQIQLMETLGMLGEVIFSPDGKFVAAADNYMTKSSGGMDFGNLAHMGPPNFVKIWHVASGVEFRSITEGMQGVSSISFSSDNSTLAIGNAGGNITLWQIRSNEDRPIRILTTHNQGVSETKFGFDGKQLIATTEKGEVLVWDVESGLSNGGSGRSLPGSRKFNHDGSLNAVVNDESIEIYKTSTGNLLHQIPAQTGSIHSLDFSPRENRIAIGSKQGEIQIWSIGSQSADQEWTAGNANIDALTFNHRGDRLAVSGQHGLVTIWNRETQTAEREIQCGESEIQHLAFSPENDLLITAERDGMLKVWRIEGEELVETITVPQARISNSIRSGVYCESGNRPSDFIAFQPHGSLMAVAEEQQVTLVDLETGKRNFELITHSKPINSVTFNPDGTLFATTSLDNTIRIWETATGKEVLTLKGHGRSNFSFGDEIRYVTDAAFDRQGQRIATVGADETIRIWDVQSGEQMLAIPEKYGSLSHAIAFDSATQRLFVHRKSTTIIEPNRFSERVLAPHLHSMFDTSSQGASCVRFHPEGTRVASLNRGNGSLKVTDLISGDELLIQTAAKYHEFSVSHDGTMIAATAEEGWIAIWSLTTGKEIRRFKGPTHNSQTISFSANDRYLAVGGVAIWEVETGIHVLDLTTHPGAIAFPDDEQQIAVASHDRIEFLNLLTGQQMDVVQVSLPNTRQLRWDPRCETIVSVNRDGLIQIWDAQTGSLLNTLRGHDEGVSDACVSSDGRMIASTGYAGRVILWDRESGARLNTIYYSGDGNYSAAGMSVDLSQDGHFLAVGTAGGHLRVIDLTTFTPSTQATTEQNNESKRPTVWKRSLTLSPQTAPTTTTSGIDLRNEGFFGFPQSSATVLHDDKDLRLSVWNNSDYLVVQAILWNDGDDLNGISWRSNRINWWVDILGDNSTLNLDLDGDAEATPDLDRNYSLNGDHQLRGLNYKLVKKSSYRSEFLSDSQGTGAIRYFDVAADRRVRVDTFAIPLSEIKKNSSDKLRLSYVAISPKPYFHLYSPTAPASEEKLWTEMHEISLSDRGEFDVSQIPQGRDDSIPKTIDPIEIVPPGGVFTDPQTVSLRPAENVPGQFYYTLDGSIPTDRSNLYTEPFPVNQSCLVKVLFAPESGYLPQAIVREFRIGEPFVKLDPAESAWTVHHLSNRDPKTDGGQWNLWEDLVVQTSTVSPGLPIPGYLVPRDGTLRLYKQTNLLTDGEIYLETKAGEAGVIGVVFRSQDEKDHYLFGLNLGNNLCSIAFRDGEGYQIRAGYPNNFEARAWNQIRIELAGPKFTVYVNGKYVSSLTDHAFTSGSLGLYCCRVKEAAFRNIAILPKQAPQNSPSVSSPGNNSPKTGNQTSIPGAGPLRIDPPGAVGPGPWTVSIQTAPLTGIIYYTLDGSRPTEKSAIYTQPVRIDKTSVLKVLCVAGSEATRFFTTREFNIEQDIRKLDLKDPAWTIVDASGGSVYDGPSEWSVNNDSVLQHSNIFQEQPSFLRNIPGNGTLRIFRDKTQIGSNDIYLDLKSQDNDSVGLAFCVQDATHYYLFAMDEQRRYHTLTIHDGRSTRILAKKNEGYEADVWHQVRIVRDGPKIAVYVNGEKDLEATDDTFSEGSIGLYCWGAEQTAFRNITVLPERK